MTKALRKAIATRSSLKNIYLKRRNEEKWVNYKRQLNFCTNLLRKTKQKYFCNLNMKDLNNNKRFWKKTNNIMKIPQLLPTSLNTYLMKYNFSYTFVTLSVLKLIRCLVFSTIIKNWGVSKSD